MERWSSACLMRPIGPMRPMRPMRRSDAFAQTDYGPEKRLKATPGMSSTETDRSSSFCQYGAVFPKRRSSMGRNSAVFLNRRRSISQNRSVFPKRPASFAQNWLFSVIDECRWAKTGREPSIDDERLGKAALFSLIDEAQRLFQAVLTSCSANFSGMTVADPLGPRVADATPGTRAAIDAGRCPKAARLGAIHT